MVGIKKQILKPSRIITEVLNAYADMCLPWYSLTLLLQLAATTTFQIKYA